MERTAELAPSAPTIRVPVAVVLSLNVAVTDDRLVKSTDARSLPYYLSWSDKPIVSKVALTWMSKPDEQRRLILFRDTRMNWTRGTSFDPVSPDGRF
jgi:hypothetical protein